MNVAIRMNSVTKISSSGVRIINQFTFELAYGSSAYICGESKWQTTLFNLVCGFDRPDAGEIWIDGRCLNELDDNKKSIFRNKHMGIIPNEICYCNDLTLLDNLAIPLLVKGMNKKTASYVVHEYAKKFGISNVIFSNPKFLTPYQSFVGAIIRALIGKPSIFVFGDFLKDANEKTRHSIMDIINEQMIAPRTLIWFCNHTSNSEYKKELPMLQID